VSLVLLVAHHGRAEAAVLAGTAIAWLEEHGHQACLLDEDATAVGLDSLAAAPEVAAGADVAISLGGDGTVLRTVELTSAKGMPIIGVNVGQLGYLTEVEPHALTSSLERYFAGDFDVEERMMLAVDVDGATHRALNEAVVEKRGSGHTVRLLVRIDGSVFTTYAADGLIVATPTGSTAYSLSARGPIVSPKHRALLLTPVSPHMLFDRSLVLDPDEDVGIELLGERPAELSVDGRRVAVLAPGDAVLCRSAAEVARFVRFGERHFHRILKAKFGLSDR
jgi:NAD+ kinase